jgi:hypothetical protein
MVVDLEEGKPAFFYEPYVDMQNRLRTKITCLIGVGSGEGWYFAYGSAVHSFDDNYDQWAGENIALQRANKVLQEFKHSNNSFLAVESYLAKITIPQHMKLLTNPQLTDLEGKLLPFRDTSPPKEGQNKESADVIEEK